MDADEGTEGVGTVRGTGDRGGSGTAADGGALLTVGAFAARARLSPKALRLYDRTGLLPPAQVDAVSGHRYYRADQVEQARTVALLRRLDMPLDTIAEVLRTPGEPAARRLVTFWRGVEERIAAQRTLVAHLRARLSGRGSPLHGTFEIRTVDAPAQQVLAQRRHILADELPAWIPASIDRLAAAAVACGGVAGPPFVVYHAEVTEESDGPAECCVPVRNATAAGMWALEQGRGQGVTVREEPARRLAYTRITRAQVEYPQILAAHEAVEEWIFWAGLRIAGPSREIYFAKDRWCSAAPGDEVCDVAFPVTG